MASDYYAFQPSASYNLEEYTRFGSISEIIVEFISKVQVSKIDDQRKISVLLEETQRFSPRTMVFLDGVPIHNHEMILAYPPALLKQINIYDGRYLFGGNDVEGIVSFVTHEGNLPYFRLSDGSQLFDYECPQLPPVMESPDYSATDIHPRKPDFRHTLYWNPFVQPDDNRPTPFSFYTSDLCGSFQIAVEGFTTDGEWIHSTARFQVTDEE
jgi:hypothetical protein